MFGKVRKTRSDCTVGTYEKKHDLPTGTIRNKDGRKARKDKTGILVPSNQGGTRKVSNSYYGRQLAETHTTTKQLRRDLNNYVW